MLFILFVFWYSFVNQVLTISTLGAKLKVEDRGAVFITTLQGNSYCLVWERKNCRNQNVLNCNKHFGWFKVKYILNCHSQKRLWRAIKTMVKVHKPQFWEFKILWFIFFVLQVNNKKLNSTHLFSFFIQREKIKKWI